jgi:hypothetical protein
MLVNSAGAPVAGAEVRILNAGISAMSDAQGRFSFRQLPDEKLDVEVRAARRSGFRMDELRGNAANDVRIELDARGEMVEATIIRRRGGDDDDDDDDDRVEAIRRLLRPAGAPDPDAHGKVEIEADGWDDQKLEIEIEDLPDGVFHVLMQGDLTLPAVADTIGAIHVHDDDDEEIEWETEDGDDLPLDAHDITDLYGRKVEIWGPLGLYLVGQVPSPPFIYGKFKGERELQPLVPLPDPEAECEIKIKSRPIKHDERFTVKLEDVPPGLYSVCVRCEATPLCPCPMEMQKQQAASGAAGSLAQRPGATPAFAMPRLSMPDTTALPLQFVWMPLRLTTDRGVLFAQATLEWDAAVAQLVPNQFVLGSDAAARGFVLDFNPMPPFAANAPATRNAIVQLHHPTGSDSLVGSGLEIARVQFRVVGDPSETGVVRVDGTGEMGRQRTFLTRSTGDVLPGNIVLDPGSITVTTPVVPGDCTLIGTIFVEPDDDDGKLKFKTKKGDMLPCGVDFVCELQGKPIEIRDAGGTLIFSGTIPCFGDDDDDD